MSDPNSELAKEYKKMEYQNELVDSDTLHGFPQRLRRGDLIHRLKEEIERLDQEEYGMS
ncbi:MAG: hypothetical protein ACMXYK_04770 [Candidatus Woesearchaeota archaeon]